MASEELQDAVIRNVEVIGEAAKRVSAEGRGRLLSLDWKSICGMRDVLIHDYIGVDLDEVWNVASARIPELQAALSNFWPDEVLAPRRFLEVPITSAFRESLTGSTVTRGLIERNTILKLSVVDNLQGQHGAGGVRYSEKRARP